MRKRIRFIDLVVLLFWTLFFYVLMRFAPRRKVPKEVDE